jgi:tetratricopeptide (TPR) repeat protein
LGSFSRSLGQLAALLERWDDAERHFQDAIEMNTRMGFHPWVALTQLNYAQMLLARDGPADREKARELLAEALAAAERMGMAKVASDSRALLSA